MRHIGSLLLAAVFGPAAFLLTGTGLSAFDTARRVSFVDDPLSPAAALGALLLAGLLYGILVMARLSPLGPGLTGMAFLGMSGWALTAPAAYEASFKQLDVHMGGAVGQWGLGFLLGVPLIATLTSPRRWRKNPYPVTGYPPPPQQPQAYAQDPYQYQYPVDPTLPDIAPPSLRYPAAMPVTPPAPPRPPAASAAPTAILIPPAPSTAPPSQSASPQAAAPPSAPRAATGTPGQPAGQQGEALPRRTPAAPDVPNAQPQPVTLLSAPTQKVGPPGTPVPPRTPITIDEDATVKIDHPSPAKGE